MRHQVCLMLASLFLKLDFHLGRLNDMNPGPLRRIGWWFWVRK